MLYIIYTIGSSGRSQRPTSRNEPAWPDPKKDGGSRTRRAFYRREGQHSQLAFEPPRHRVELVEVAILDVHHAPLAAVVDHDFEAERVGDALLERHRV